MFYVILFIYAGSAAVFASIAARQSWRQGRRGYAMFAGTVAIIAVMAGATVAHLEWASQ